MSDSGDSGSIAANQVPMHEGTLTENEKVKEGDWTPIPDLAIVTGAFSYTGRYVARRLLDQGVRVRTLTRSPNAEDPFGRPCGGGPSGLLRP